jgi:hypothetical protein
VRSEWSERSGEDGLCPSGTSRLDVAEAWGYVEAAEIGAARAFADRILAMTWRMTH